MTLPGSSNLPSAPCWALSQAATPSSTWASTLMNGRACRKQRSTKAESLHTACGQVLVHVREVRTCKCHLPGASRRIAVSEGAEGAVGSLIGQLLLVTWREMQTAWTGGGAEWDGECSGGSPVRRYAMALAVLSGSACPVALRYCSTYTFGAKLIMFCSPQPQGNRIRSSRPVIDGPRRSPWQQTSAQIMGWNKFRFKVQNVCSLVGDQQPDDQVIGTYPRLSRTPSRCPSPDQAGNGS